MKPLDLYKSSHNVYYMNQKEVDLLQKLEIELKIKGFSKATIKVYRNYALDFLTFIKKGWTEIGTDDVKAYQAFLAEKENKASTVRLKLSAIRFLFHEVLEKEIITNRIKYPKSPNKIPEALTKEEVQKILAVIKNNKHKLLIEFMYGSGLRVSECVNFKIKDINFSDCTAKVVSGKGNKERMILLSKSFSQKLKDYVEPRRQLSEFIFPSKNLKSPISVRGVQKLLKKAAEKSGLEKRVYCHILRSSFATHLLEDHVDTRYIQELLGHSDLSTTQRYTKVNIAQLKKIKSPLDSLEA